jgi:hypothetical protein
MALIATKQQGVQRGTPNIVFLRSMLDYYRNYSWIGIGWWGMTLLNWFLEDRVRTLWLLLFIVISISIGFAFVVIPIISGESILTPPKQDACEPCIDWDSAYQNHPNIRNPTIQECVNTSRPASLKLCCDYKYGHDLYYQKKTGGI